MGIKDGARPALDVGQLGEKHKRIIVLRGVGLEYRLEQSDSKCIMTSGAKRQQKHYTTCLHN